MPLATMFADPLSQLLQLGGAIFVLAGFVAAQAGVLATSSRTYLLLNLVGSATLAILAAIEHQPGFLLLEGSWAVVSAASLVRRGEKAS